MISTGAAYTASKHGLVGLTKNTGAYYGAKGIRCNAIAAGQMDTNIALTLSTEGCNQDGIARMRRNCTFCPIVQAWTFVSMLMVVSHQTVPDWGGIEICDVEKVAEIVLFLSSDAAQIVNGAVWTADAGVTAG